MWTLKQIELERNAEQPLTLNLTMTLEKSGEVDVILKTTIESKQVLDDTVRNALKKLNEQDDLIDNAGSYTIPEPETPPEPTAVEVAEKDFRDELAEYEETKKLNEAVPDAINSVIVAQQAQRVQTKYVTWQNRK